MAGVIIAILAALMTLSPLVLTAQPFSDDHLIVPGISIGLAELQPEDQGALVRALGEPDQTGQDGDHVYYRYGPDDGLVVDFDLANDAPFEIWTSSAAYRTQAGLGVGSTEEAIRTALGQPLCAAHQAQAGLLVYPSIWFATRDGRAIRVSIRTHLSARDFRTGPLHC